MAEDKTDALEGNDISQNPAVQETPEASQETPDTSLAAPDAPEGADDEDIETDPVEMVVCPGCKAEIDTTEVPPFSEIACPACGATISVEGKLGAYRLLRKLGSGGMGAVFAGQDDALNRKVAIKVVKRSLGANPAMMEAFKREAQATAKLNHPNIVQIYAFGDQRGQPFIAMELVGGGSLDGLIAKKVRMDPAFVMRVGKEIALALGAAQEAGLIHGDVKPENILFDENYRAKLVDFGIASALSADVNAKEIWGTPYYIAPEKARGKKADIRSDLYSLGATLYHALTLRPPFEGPDARAVVAARFKTAPTPIGRFRPDVDRKAVEIVERMMHPNPMMRFPNVNALVSAIDEFLKTVTPPTRADKPAAGLPTGVHPRITGVRMQAVSAPSSSGELPAEEPAIPAPGGKKKIIISKSRRPVNLTGAQPAEEFPTADPETGDFPIQPEMDIPPPKPKMNAAKGCLIAFFVLLGLVVAGAIGAIVYFVGANKKSEAEIQQRFATAKQMEAAADSLGAAVAAAAEPILKLDAEMQKTLLKEVTEVVGKVAGNAWALPSLEPTEPIQIEPSTPEAAKPEAEAPKPEPKAPKADPKDLKAIKDEPAFANGKNAEARKAIIAFAMDKANAALLADPAVVAKVLAVVRDPENAKDADVMEIAVKAALEEAKTAAEAKAAEAPAEGDAETPAEGDAAAETPAEDGAAETPAENDAAEAADDAPAGPSPEELAFRAASQEFAQKANKALDPARRIRRARREAELLRDRQAPEFAPIKGDTVTDAQYNERAQYKAVRERDRKRCEELLAACQKDLAELKRNIGNLQKASRPLLDAIQARAAAAEKEREEEAARAKAAQAENARKAKIQREVDEAEGVVRNAEESVQEYDYDHAISLLAPYLGESFSSDEARTVIQNAHDKFTYLSGLRAFFLKDLHENGGLARAIDRRFDIADADPARGTVTTRNGEEIDIAKFSLVTWMRLIDQLVDNRDPTRARIGTSQRGDLLYGSAIFCIVHGNGNEAATARAIEFARKAREFRETVKRDIPRLTPELKDALEE